LISKETFREAVFELCTDRDLALGHSPDNASVLDEWLASLTQKRIDELKELSYDEKRTLYQTHIDEFAEKGGFFPGGEETLLANILINDVNIVTDSYICEIESGEVTKEELDKIMLNDKELNERTSEMLGGPKKILELYNTYIAQGE